MSRKVSQEYIDDRFARIMPGFCEGLDPNTAAAIAVDTSIDEVVVYDLRTGIAYTGSVFGGEEFARHLRHEVAFHLGLEVES